MPREENNLSRPEPQRRRSARVPLNAVVHYHMDGSDFVNLASDISEDGIFIRNFSPPPVGTEVRLKVRLPDQADGQLQLVGKVVRVADSVGVEERGMGVEFAAIQADSLQTVRRFVREIFGIGRVEEVIQATGEGAFRFAGRPQDVLRLQAGEYQQPPAGVSQYRLLRSLLLVMVGMLLGGGVFFLASLLLVK